MFSTISITGEFNRKLASSQDTTLSQKKKNGILSDTRPCPVRVQLPVCTTSFIMPSEVHQLWAQNLNLEWHSPELQLRLRELNRLTEERGETIIICHWMFPQCFFSDLVSLNFILFGGIFVWLRVIQIPNTILPLDITACSSIFSKYCWQFSNAPCKFVHLLSYLHCKWVCCCLHTS